MGKRVVLAVFGGIAMLGLVMSIVGWSMGGEVGSLNVRDGDMVYHTSQESVSVGKAPAWANGDFMVMNLNWRNVWDEMVETRTNVSYTVDAMEGLEAAEGAMTESGEFYAAAAMEGMSQEDFSGPGWEVTGENIQTSGPVTEVDLPFTAAELVNVELDIDTGYVVVQQGEQPGLTVRGPLAFEQDFSGGIWTLASDTDVDAVRPKQTGDNEVRFYEGGRDVTTVFIITLPKDTPMLESHMALGVTTLKGVEAQSISVSQAMGSVQVQNGNARDFSLNVEMGVAKVKGLKADICLLSAELGNIEFDGEVKNLLDVNCELGSVDVTIPRPTGGYEADCTVDLGSLVLDGNSYTPMGSSNVSSGAGEMDITLACDLGTVRVTMEG